MILMFKKMLLVFVFISPFVLQAQDRFAKNGRVMGDFFELDKIMIQNLNSNESTLTEKGGYFKIQIAVNDTLLVISENFKRQKILISTDDIRSSFLYISLKKGDNTLEELVIKKEMLDNSYLDPRVRRKGLYKDLYTATSGGPISKFINFLSGRTNMIKKAIEYQNENDMAERMINSMSESFFVDELQIPKEYIGGFGYYLLNDVDVVTAVKNRNEFQLQFLLPTKAKMYLETLKEYQQ